MKVEAIKCPKCKDTIYSRANHDYHYCTCGAVAIDGGRNYTKVSWDPSVAPPDTFELDLGDKITQHDLYFDWNYRIDFLGTIHDPTVKREYVYYCEETNDFLIYDYPDNVAVIDNDYTKMYDIKLIGIL